MSEGSDSKPRVTERGGRRRPYRRPQLVRLGTLTELTGLVGTVTQKSDTHGTKTT
jgi:hypothetical protein